MINIKDTLKVKNVLKSKKYRIDSYPNYSGLAKITTICYSEEEALKVHEDLKTKYELISSYIWIDKKFIKKKSSSVHLTSNDEVCIAMLN